MLARAAQGTVDLHSISKIMFVYSVDKQCLLQGKAGPILATGVLFNNPSVPHPCDKLGLMALANENMVPTSLRFVAADV